MDVFKEEPCLDSDSSQPGSTLSACDERKVECSVQEDVLTAVKTEKQFSIMETEFGKCCQYDPLSTRSEDADNPKEEELNRNNTSLISEMNGNKFSVVLIKEEPQSDPGNERETSSPCDVKKEDCRIEDTCTAVKSEEETATGSQLPTLLEDCTFRGVESTTNEVRIENNTNNDQEKLSAGDNVTNCEKYLKEKSNLTQSDESSYIPERIKKLPTNLKMIKTHSDCLYQCDICNKWLKHHKNLKVHLRNHTNDRPYSCDVCKKSYAKNSNLTAHYRIHTGERPYLCELCKKSFVRSDALQKHIRSHTGQRPYSCDYCNKTFSCSSNLKQHIVIHSGERPYICDKCNSSFSWLNRLKHHKRTQCCLRTKKD